MIIPFCYWERSNPTPWCGKGDHVNIKMPNGRIVTLRGKGEVKVGRLKDAIREAGLTVEEFVELTK